MTRLHGETVVGSDFPVLKLKFKHKRRRLRIYSARMCVCVAFSFMLPCPSKRLHCMELESILKFVVLCNSHFEVFRSNEFLLFFPIDILHSFWTHSCAYSKRLLKQFSTQLHGVLQTKINKNKHKIAQTPSQALQVELIFKRYLLVLAITNIQKTVLSKTVAV